MEVNVKDQHKLITGYRDLTAEEITLMNSLKEKGQELGVIIDKLEANPDLDQRWVEEAKTTLQKGIMFAVRSIARPTTF